MARITIPYAVADFAEMRERGFYYVDKTNYIPGLEDYNAPIFLRPRRFGKSLLISMLAHYYDRTKANRFEELFGGTWIGEHPTKEHNQYMVIRYDFSAMVMADDMEGVVQNFNDLNCGPVEVTVEHNRDLFGDFQFTTRGNAVQMLEELLGYISSHGLPKAYILIDEYDNFTNQLLTSYNDSLYEEVTTSDSFLLTFFKVIKAGIGEGTIRTCFCTGVLPVIMDDLTSGYNIAEILTFKPVFLNMLGFTYEETKTYLRYVLDKYAPGASEERFEEIWQLIVNNYDGYRFSPVGERLFNSTILTYFLKKFAANAGSIPPELIDENLRTDINWIRRLTLSKNNAKETLDALVIPLLARHFADRQAVTNGLPRTEFSADALQFLSRLPYPGNIRELKNLVERTILVSGKPLLDASDFDAQYIRHDDARVTEGAALAGMTLDEIERQTILQALDRYKGNLSQVATALGISRAALYRRLEKYNITM